MCAEIAESDLSEMSDSLHNLSTAVLQVIETTKLMGRRQSWRDIRSIRRAAEKALDLVETAKGCPPPQGADIAAMDMGLI